MRKVSFKKWFVVPFAAAAIALALGACTTMSGGAANRSTSQNQMQTHHSTGYGM